MSLLCNYGRQETQEAWEVNFVGKRSGISQQDSRTPHDERNKKEVDELICRVLVIAAVEDQLVHEVHIYAKLAHPAHRYITTESKPKFQLSYMHLGQEGKQKWWQ